METQVAKQDERGRRGQLPDPARVTAARVRLAAERETVADWAAKHGERATTVYKVLSGRRSCESGDARRIAEKLGIKDASLRGGSHA